LSCPVPSVAVQGNEHSDVDASVSEQGRLDDIEAAVHEFAPVGAR
jgi:hypothetical protein